MSRPVDFSRILQEAATTQSMRECFDVVWQHREYIESLPTPMREYLFESIQDTVEQRGWMLPLSKESSSV
jgi:hypothetical protein